MPNLFHGKFRKQWLKAINKSSMRAAVNAKCADCTNWQNVEIRECTVVTCPLWQYRPNFPGKPDDAERRKRILAASQSVKEEFESCIDGRRQQESKD
jgi:hypothetical protein